MTLEAAIASVSISQVWAALGGGPLRHGRGRAFWRDGDGYNVSLSDDKGAWYDFATQAKGGILDLIQTVLEGDRSSAVRWLSETFGLEIDGQRRLTPAERQRYAHARREAERFVQWRSERLEQMRQERNYHLSRYHSALRRIVTHGLNHPNAEQWADAHDEHEAKYQALDEQIDAFVAAPFEQLVPRFRLEHRRSA